MQGDAPQVGAADGDGAGAQQGSTTTMEGFSAPFAGGPAPGAGGPALGAGGPAPNAGGDRAAARDAPSITGKLLARGANAYIRLAEKRLAHGGDDNRTTAVATTAAAPTTKAASTPAATTPAATTTAATTTTSHESCIGSWCSGRPRVTCGRLSSRGAWSRRRFGRTTPGRRSGSSLATTPTIPTNAAGGVRITPYTTRRIVCAVRGFTNPPTAHARHPPPQKRFVLLPCFCFACRNIFLEYKWNTRGIQIAVFHFCC